MDIGQWLDALGLGQYAQSFADNDVDLAMLVQLSDADLKEIGVAPLGHRKRLLAAIAERSEPPSAPASDERRQVTILFADLCGFTALSHTLDAEDLNERIGRYTALVDDIVLGYGGTIDKHIGDAVMALFGAPRAHDSDALRAARAALDIHAALADLGKLAAHPLVAHIGIASGEVIAGTHRRAGVRDYTVIGDSVNLAARLVDAAGPGDTLIADGLRRSLGEAVSADALGEMRFKGIDAPVRVWRLTGIEGERSSDNRSRFVGRKAELEQFRGIARACMAALAGQAVYVRGDAGIGKSRLAEEMRRTAEALGFATHRGRVLDFGMGRGQEPVRAIVGSLLGLSPTADVVERGETALRVATADQLMFLHDLLDLPQTGEWRTLYDAMDNRARDRGKRALVASLVQGACVRGPVMIVVEDLHWADPQTLGFLSAIAAALANGPGLVVMTSRVEGDPLDAAWRASCRGTPFATIDLGPLRRTEALDLAESFIDATQRVALACIERADGNPLFLEQLLRNAEEGRDDAVPASIRSLVLARMDRLPALDRQAFQAAAAIGQRFGLALLRQLIDAPDYVCDGLVANALVLPEGDDFLFAHALIQEGAYSTLLHARRRELHRRAADWFAASDPVLCAQHLDRAEDARAAHAYLDAALAQRAAWLPDDALRLIARGLAIARDDGERHALRCLMGELQRDLGEVGASIETYRMAVAAAPDDVCLCRAQLGLAESLRVSEGLTEAQALLDAAQEVAERHDLVAERARLHHLRGNILFPLGRIDGCRDEHERGLTQARRSGSPEAEARALGGLADAAYAQGRMRTAFEHFSRCVELSREHGLGRIEVANRSMVGFSRMYLNEARQARDDGAAAVRAAALVGQPRAEMLGETMGVFAALELGHAEETRLHLDHEMRLIRQLGARRFEAQNLENRARLLIDANERPSAAQLLREALAICGEVGTQFSGPKALSALSRAVDDPAERLQLLAQGAELLRQGAVGHNHLWFHRDAVEAMLAASDAAGALRHAAALDDYTRLEPLPWATLFAARGRALADVLQGRVDEALTCELLRVRAELADAGFVTWLPAVDCAIAAA